MRVTLTSTSAIIELNGLPCRIWEGFTAKGVPCFAYVALVGHPADADAAEFEADLQEVAPPRAAVLAISPQQVP